MVPAGARRAPGIRTLEVPALEVSAPVVGGRSDHTVNWRLSDVFAHSVNLHAADSPLLVNLSAGPVQAVCQARVSRADLARLRQAGIGTTVRLLTGAAVVVRTRLTSRADAALWAAHRLDPAGHGAPADHHAAAEQPCLDRLTAPASWFDTPEGTRYGRPRLTRAALIDDADLAALTGLLGLGIGLTPSGDDALVGLLAVSRTVGIGATLRHQLGQLLTGPRAGNLTTETSLCQLRLAAEGDFSPLVLDLMKALTGDQAASADRARYALDRLAGVGHSSGADLIAGARALSARREPGIPRTWTAGRSGPCRPTVDDPRPSGPTLSGPAGPSSAASTPFLPHPDRQKDHR